MQNTNKFKIDFIGIGAIRSATTWIAQCLREHPQICLPDIKEINFFCHASRGSPDEYRNYSKGIKWYEKQFSCCSKEQIKGEFSSNCLYDFQSPKLINRHFPKIKIITCLRNPVDRAYSHYWWNRATLKRHRQQTFEQAIKTYPEYIERGFYFKNLAKYYKVFPKEQIHIILFNDIIEQFKEVISELYKFLKASPDFVPASLDKKINPSQKVRAGILTKIFPERAFLERTGCGFVIDFLKRINLYQPIQNLYIKLNREPFRYPPMEENLRNKLKKEFCPDIEKLEGLINRDLSAWK